METCKDRDLKHLGFVKIAAIQALGCISSLYEYAKHNSGFLKSTVGSVEAAVTSVVSPVYQNFKGVPEDLLLFVDHKVDETSTKLEKNSPSLVKQITGQAYFLIHKTSEEMFKIVHLLKVEGPQSTLHYITTGSKQFVFDQSVEAWVKLSKYPQLHSVAMMVVPVAAQGSEIYNNLVKDLTHKGYTIFGYFPLVPVDELANAFKKTQPDVANKGEEEDTNAAPKVEEVDTNAAPKGEEDAKPNTVSVDSDSSVEA